MSRSGIQPVPQWVSGHQPDGSVSDDESGHLACIPLPFAGHEHADGHLLGVGLVFPRALNRQERGRVLGPLLMTSDGQPCEVELKFGRLGLWTVKRRDWAERRQTLQPETWTAHPTGARTWASVTPVVLDRFPKADRTKDRMAWTDEVVAIIAGACTRIGLPRPVGIDIDTTCWHGGGPRAVGKRRPLRGSVGTGASLGDGFPFYPPKGAKASRPQVHVWLEFAQPVVGPILLGAGRYQGYGLCKPVNGSKEAGR
jgi:CRISPR-associated protein Csb2